MIATIHTLVLIWGFAQLRRGASRTLVKELASGQADDVWDDDDLYDESQAVAKAFDARCTPDLFIFDPDGKLAYRGQFDDARPGNGIVVTGRDARTAVEALLAGRTPAAEQKASIGCNIKWKD